MAKGFYESRIYILLCIAAFLACDQKPDTQDIGLSSPEDASVSTIDRIFQMASDKNPICLELTDSILNSTSDASARAEAFYIKGLYYSNIKDNLKAEQYLDSTIKENYTFYDAYIEKGILLNEKGDYENALATLQIALEITKNNADLYYWIGASYEGLKKMLIVCP